MPKDRLCPPVPVRWNYVRWLQELIDSSRPWDEPDDYRFHDLPDRDRLISGLDIGVGASCIYSLLACASRPNWSMFGTDIDESSLSWSARNVEANRLTSRIKLHQSTATGPIIPLTDLGCSSLDFVMTNPPFYSSHEDMVASYSGKKMAPSAVCLGSENEMICPGGDLGFATRILEESLLLRTKVQWYSVMLARLKSAEALVEKLKAAGITNFAASDLQAGYKTKRWAIAWSFHGFRPRNDVARHGALVWNIMPGTSTQTILVPLQDAKWSGRTVNETLQGLDVKWLWRPLLDAGVMTCSGDVWSRAARRRKRQKLGDESAIVEEAAPERSAEVALAVSISCMEEKVEIRWLRGQERLLFESFCGKIKRALTVRE